jgi:DNA-directed RNA polymerase III subunit RPC8
MFVLVEIRDSIKVLPSRFSLPLSKSVSLEITRLYANKVIPNQGLCITLYDILELGEPLVRPGDPSAYTKVRFRLVVFRPVLGQVLAGKVKSSSEEGVSISMVFFDDIHVPASMLPAGSFWSREEHVWVWELGENKLFIDVGEEIRFRVIAEAFEEPPPLLKEQAVVGKQITASTIVPYKITASIAEDGLGLLSWWK